MNPISTFKCNLKKGTPASDEVVQLMRPRQMGWWERKVSSYLRMRKKKKKLPILASPNIIILSKLEVFLSTAFFFLIHSSLISVLNGWCQLTGIVIVKWLEPMLGPNENLRPGPHKIQPAIIHNRHNKIRPSSITFAYAQENSTYFLSELRLHYTYNIIFSSKKKVLI